MDGWVDGRIKCSLGNLLRKPTAERVSGTRFVNHSLYKYVVGLEYKEEDTDTGILWASEWGLHTMELYGDAFAILCSTEKYLRCCGFMDHHTNRLSSLIPIPILMEICLRNTGKRNCNSRTAMKFGYPEWRSLCYFMLYREKAKWDRGMNFMDGHSKEESYLIIEIIITSIFDGL